MDNIAKCITFDVTAHKNAYPGADYNAFRDFIESAGYKVEGNRDENDNVYMIIHGLDATEAADEYTFQGMAEECGLDGDVADFICMDDDCELSENCIDGDCEDNDGGMLEEDVEFFNEFIDEDENPFDIEDEMPDDFADTVENVAVDDVSDVATPVYDDLDSVNDADVDGLTPGSWEADLMGDEEDYIDEPVDPDYYDDIDEAFRVNSDKKNLNEKKKGCCPPKRKSSLNSLIPLSEALKAFDEKDQKKLDKTVKSIEDIIKSVKGQTIGEGEADAAYKKLKKEQNAIKKIRKDEDTNFKLTDVSGAAGAIKKLIAAYPAKADEIKKFQGQLCESVAFALENRKHSLHENKTLNNVKVKDITSNQLMSIFNKQKALKESLTAQLRESEAGSFEADVIKDKIANKVQVLRLIMEELSYRKIAKDVFTKLNEEEDTEKNDDSTASDNSMDDLAAMFGSADAGLDVGDDNEAEPAEDDTEMDDATEEIEIARIVIQMASKEDAEQLIDFCKDAGIPEEAMEIETGSDEDVKDDKEGEASEDEANADDAEGDDTDASEGEANESVNYANIRALFEDENEDVPADDTEADDAGDTEADDAEGEGETEEENADDEIKFVLTDTNYVTKLAEVLADEYGITKDEFNEMIGGEIVEEDEPAFEENDADEGQSGDDDGEDTSADEDEGDDDLTAADIFKDM